MTHLLRKSLTGAVIAAGLVAMVAASSTGAEAGWRGRHSGWGAPRGGAIAAGIIGGLALGALAGSVSRGYAAPVYADPDPLPPAYPAPVYGSNYAYQDGCHHEWRPVYTSDGRYLRDRRVTVCD